MHSRLVLAVALLALPPATRAQQTAVGKISGVVRDSMFNGPLIGATVYVRPVVPPSSVLRLAVTDEHGRYRVDSLAAGTYAVTFSSGLTDSLSYVAGERQAEVRAGEETRVDLATPSAATLRAAACPGVPLTPGEGALYGVVTDAENTGDRPLIGALVVVAWNDFELNRATLQSTTTTRTGGATTDSLGRYRLCGVPSGVPLLVQVQHGGRAGSLMQLTIRDSIGVWQQPIAFSEVAAREIAALDSAAARHDSVLPPLSGSASLAGVVRTVSGQPVGDAQVSVAGAAPVTRTDSSGHFQLRGLPAGTQELQVRRVGYSRARVPVTLRDGMTSTQDVAMQRFVSLDSIKVIATRVRYAEFEARAKRGGFGRFLREEDIARRNPFNTSDLIRTMPGLRVDGSGFDARVVSTRSLGMRGFGRFGGGRCELNVVIDRMQHQDINLVSPHDIAAMEVYAGSAGAPPEFDSTCGLIVIWTK